MRRAPRRKFRRRKLDKMTLPVERTFIYCPRCGTQHPDPGKVPFRCGECQFAMFFGPVAAVGALIINDQDQLLLVRRARNPGKGKWGLPGGFVDRDETAEDALRREVREETRLELTSLDLLTTFPNQYDYQGILSWVIDLFYVCRAADESSITLEAKELDQFVWSDPQDKYLNQMAFPSNRRAIEFWIQQCASRP